MNLRECPSSKLLWFSFYFQFSFLFHSKRTPKSIELGLASPIKIQIHNFCTSNLGVVGMERSHSTSNRKKSDVVVGETSAREPPTCPCELKTVERTSRTGRNPARRFFGCALYKVSVVFFFFLNLCVWVTWIICVFDCGGIVWFLSIKMTQVADILDGLTLLVVPHRQIQLQKWWTKWTKMGNQKLRVQLPSFILERIWSD